MIPFASLTTQRILIEANLTPVQGSRFQPTGFADLGAATYTLPDGTHMLLVESAQSMANRLEQTIQTADGHLVPGLAGLSYVESTLKGLDKDIVTTSLIEAHRLNSPFIIGDREFQKKFCEEAVYADDKPLNWKLIAAALFKYDINSLLHGIFLANVGGGRIKTPRLISAFIEAADVREVVSGGVKNNHIDPKGEIQIIPEEQENKKDQKNKKDKGGSGNVPYPRIEYTAGCITAYFNLDLGGIKALGLPQEAEELLSALALYKIRVLLNGGLRLRTACDLRLAGDLRCSGIEALPDEAELLAQVQKSIKQCAPLFANPPMTVLEVKVKKSSKKDKAAGKDSSADNDDE